MNKLIGKTIKEVKIDTRNEFLIFTCEEGELTYYVEGDCCSRSWIQHVENAEGLIGAKVASIEETNCETLNETNDRDDVIKAHFYKIHLENRQPFSFEFRNSSNGYYDGYIVEWVRSIPDEREFRILSTDF